MTVRLTVSWTTLLAGVLVATSCWANEPERAPLAATDAERRVLDVIADLERTGEKGGIAVSAADGRLLRVLAASMGAKRVVEVGTLYGYSSLWLALALRSTDGRLTTFELEEENAARARENFRRAGVDDVVEIVVGDAHEKVAKLSGPIDLVFLDADKPGYVDYLHKLRPLLRPGGLVVAHNMRRPAPDPRYIEAITTDPGLETVFLLMQGAGMGVTLKKGAE